MHRRSLALVVTAALLATAAAAWADSYTGPIRRHPSQATESRGEGIHGRTILRVHAGLSAPTGDFGDGLDTGWAIGASAGYGVSRTVLLSGGLAYHRFDTQGPGSGHVSVTPFTLNADVALPSRSRVVPWFGGGIGIYHVSESAAIVVPLFGSGTASVSEDDPGVNFGLGFGAPASQGMLFGAGVKYHHIFGDNFIDADLFTFQFGFAFDL
jgi:opacity protein-like surface antigen